MVKQGSGLNVLFPKRIGVEKTIYKIRRKSDGFFSIGGSYPSFNKDGKLWTNLGHLKRHLSILTVRTIDYKYSDCDIVEYELREIESSKVSIKRYTTLRGL